MRPNQQNNKNRSRGRNNNGGRKHINPLSRNFESNGPDVKVRGNAAHIAEKYVQLARDAQASGDSVMAENYLQHAEHYFRIVSAAQPQGMPRSDQFNSDDGFEDEYDLGDNNRFNNRFSSPDRQQQNAPEAEAADAGNGEGETAETSGQQQPAPAAAEANAAEGEQEAAEPRRQRRPRRRRPANGEAASADLANADQPEVGELPAFITAGGTPTAAE